MINQLYCSCCGDKRKFESKVLDVARIVNALKRYKQTSDFPQTRAFKELEHTIISDRTYPHFMCGTCHQVNTYQLQAYEKTLDDTLLKVVASLTGKNMEYNNILRLLAGHYPIKYRAIERYMTKKARE